MCIGVTSCYKQKMGVYYLIGTNGVNFCHMWPALADGQNHGWYSADCISPYNRARREKCEKTLLL